MVAGSNIIFSSIVCQIYTFTLSNHKNTCFFLSISTKMQLTQKCVFNPLLIKMFNTVLSCPKFGHSGISCRLYVLAFLCRKRKVASQRYPRLFEQKRVSALSENSRSHEQIVSCPGGTNEFYSNLPGVFLAVRGLLFSGIDNSEDLEKSTWCPKTC